MKCYKKIRVPFTYETKLSGIEDGRRHDNIWYHRVFQVDASKLEKLIHKACYAVLKDRICTSIDLYARKVSDRRVMLCFKEFGRI